MKSAKLKIARKSCPSCFGSRYSLLKIWKKKYVLSAFGVLGIKIWPLSLLFSTRTSTCTLRSALRDLCNFIRRYLKINLNVLLLDFTVPIHKLHTNRTYKRCKWLKLVSNPSLIFSCFEENCGAGIRTGLCKLGRLPIFTVRFNTLFFFYNNLFTRTFTLIFEQKFNKTYGMK